MLPCFLLYCIHVCLSSILNSRSTRLDILEMISLPLWMISVPLCCCSALSFSAAMLPIRGTKRIYIQIRLSLTVAPEIVCFYSLSLSLSPLLYCSILPCCNLLWSRIVRPCLRSLFLQPLLNLSYVSIIYSTVNEHSTES